MGFITEDYLAYLNMPLDAKEVYLPLSTPAYSDLLRMLSHDTSSFTYLTLRDDTHFETVKAYARGGYIMLDRGFGGTNAYKFPVGTCVTTVSPTIVAAIQLAAGKNADFNILQYVTHEHHTNYYQNCEGIDIFDAGEIE